MPMRALTPILLISALCATEASAKLLDASITPKDEAAIAALHRPTGCLAQVTFADEMFIKAQITDPDCLPKGVYARDIPATLMDFVVTPHERSEEQRYPSHLLRRR